MLNNASEGNLKLQKLKGGAIKFKDVKYILNISNS